MKKQYTFVLNFGYVESAGLSYMPWSSSEKYATAKDALIDLATFFKEQYLLQHKVELKSCCEANKKKDPEASFCSKCRRSLKEEEFDDEAFIDWLQGMANSNIDSFHGEYMDYDPDNQRWQSDGLEGALNQRFVYQAEWVLAAAIGYPHGDVTFEDICKERTKEKRESFSYY